MSEYDEKEKWVEDCKNREEQVAPEMSDDVLSAPGHARGFYQTFRAFNVPRKKTATKNNEDQAETPPDH